MFLSICRGNRQTFEGADKKARHLQARGDDFLHVYLSIRFLFIVPCKSKIPIALSVNKRNEGNGEGGPLIGFGFIHGFPVSMGEAGVHPSADTGGCQCCWLGKKCTVGGHSRVKCNQLLLAKLYSHIFKSSALIFLVIRETQGIYGCVSGRQ